MSGPYWGIDLGGTKIEGVVFDTFEDLNVLARMRLPTEREKGYQHILNQIQKLVESMTTHVGVRPEIIGIGTPGTLDPQTQKLKNSNTTCLNGQYLKSDLEAVLGIPLRMANDANCFALAETKLGIVREKVPNANVVWGIIMGTGTGSGIVVGGKVLSGLHGIGGEWGHNFLDESGGPCYCGHSGCTEMVISGPALSKYYASLTGEELPMAEIVKRFERGREEAAQMTMERLLHFFGMAVARVINIIDPDAIVIGGGLGNIELLYDRGPFEVAKHIFNDRLATPFLKPKLGDSAGVFGAALLTV
ncbi:MAG: sugar kinase [Saprospirales bacterium]|nr:sugar kinase [Saprospirales bacterium]